ncbi:putative MFS transporter [Amycolatopsis bartoniae]|uniref:Putative metabolite transport protein YyaJ n=1 Tax=Amycolatopsis bartoniae TaxID=941986 RepID=A0A8H9IQU5_9PSEU|nr:MFS transporter [Amycolatopsis bartoniae]MBB2936740.1 putative MFS transporter [Amycolatopsis bartoniae]TVT09207.1 MFS transporter [Amycolatopsis bartoniae]GHF49813.1 putative metabolite transport protein YyaJ [Amycolatopsis bartoniae]
MTSAQLAARLDRLPIGRFHRRVLYALAVAFVFEFGDLNTFAYAAPALKEHLHLTVDDIAFVTSASFLGMFAGAVLGGRFADRIGRRRALLVSVAVFSVCSLLNAVASTVPTLAVARLLTGVGLSAMTVAATTYISETMPAAHRGRMQAGVMAIGLLGIPVMSFSARGVIPLSAGSWRLVFVFGALGLLALPLVARLPESPRWLLRHGHEERADAVVTAVEREHGPLPELVVREEPDPAKVSYRALLTGKLGRRTLMLAVAWVFQTLGFYGFVSWVPTLLAEHGFGLVHSLTFSALTTLGAVPGALLAWAISDRFGRKTPIVVVALAVAVCGVAYGLTFNAVAIVAFGFCVNALIQTFAAMLYAYTPELYPTELRNSGNGLVYGLGRLSNIAGPLIVAAIFGAFGYQPVFVYIGACWLVVAATIGFFGPRTGMRNLEHLTGEAASALDDVVDQVRRPG